MDSAISVQVRLDDLRAGLVVSYGEDGRTFAIDGRDFEKFVLQQFVERKKKQVAASLN